MLENSKNNDRLLKRGGKEAIMARYIEIQAAREIDSAAKEAVEVVRRTGEEGWFLFNGYKIDIGRTTTARRAVRQYHRKIHGISPSAGALEVFVALAADLRKNAQVRRQEANNHKTAFEVWVETVLRPGLWQPGETRLAPGDVFLLREGSRVSLVRVDDADPEGLYALAQVGKNWRRLPHHGTWASRVVDDPPRLERLARKAAKGQNWAYPYARKVAD